MANNSTSPSLPPEIWLEVFSFALHVPGLFDTNWDYHPDDLLWEGVWAPTETKRERDSFELRKIIVQVSREWWAIGRHFLFEDLVVSSSEKAQELGALFEKSHGCTSGENGGVGVGESPAGYGQWVKRITVTTELWFYNSDTIFPHLERLLAQCCNAQVLHVNVDMYTTPHLPQVSRLLRSPFSRSLRRISFQKLPFAEESMTLFDHSHTPHKLGWVTLPLDWVGRVVPISSGSTTPATLSNLSVLEINIDSNFHLPALSFPSLRYLSLISQAGRNIMELLSFMMDNGPGLLGLSLKTFERLPAESLYQLLEHTTSLRSLVFSDSLDQIRPSQTPSFPSITHLGHCGINYTGPGARRVHHELTNISRTKIFPNLKIFRILSNDIPYSLGLGWRKPVATAAQYGIRLDDRNGRLVQDYSIGQPRRARAPIPESSRV